MKPRCPVCGAAFRGTIECSRCGADLSTLMRLTARAARLRREAASAVLRGEFASARAMATAADRAHSTPGSRKLRSLAEWLEQVPKSTA